jgi:transcription-repair coupling factor (superfamily II helicase)
MENINIDISDLEPIHINLNNPPPSSFGSGIELLMNDKVKSNSNSVTINMKELDDLETEDKLVAFGNNLKDRFGAVPPQVIELMNTIRLRWKARQLGFEKIVLKNRTLKTYFISNQQSAYFQSTLFNGVLRFVQANPRLCKMKEEKGKLSLTLTSVGSIRDANDLLERMLVANKSITEII